MGRKAKTGNRRLTIPPGKKGVLIDEAVTKVFTLTNGEPDKNLSDYVSNEKRNAVSEYRNRNDGAVSNKCEPRRPQSVEDLAQETIQRADCSFGLELFIPALVDAINERTFRTLKMHASQAQDSAQGIQKQMESAQVVRESFKRILGN